jgi:hypothetical protein
LWVLVSEEEEEEEEAAGARPHPAPGTRKKGNIPATNTRILALKHKTPGITGYCRKKEGDRVYQASSRPEARASGEWRVASGARPAPSARSSEVQEEGEHIFPGLIAYSEYSCGAGVRNALHGIGALRSAISSCA